MTRELPPPRLRRCGMCGHRNFGRSRTRCPSCGAEWGKGTPPFKVAEREVEAACPCFACQASAARPEDLGRIGISVDRQTPKQSVGAKET